MGLSLSFLNAFWIDSSFLWSVSVIQAELFFYATLAGLKLDSLLSFQDYSILYYRKVPLLVLIIIVFIVVYKSVYFALAVTLLALMNQAVPYFYRNSELDAWRHKFFYSKSMIIPAGVILSYKSGVDFVFIVLVFYVLMCIYLFDMLRSMFSVSALKDEKDVIRLFLLKSPQLFGSFVFSYFDVMYATFMESLSLDRYFYLIDRGSRAVYGVMFFRWRKFIEKNKVLSLVTLALTGVGVSAVISPLFIIFSFLSFKLLSSFNVYYRGRVRSLVLLVLSGIFYALKLMWNFKISLLITVVVAGMWAELIRRNENL